MPVRRTDVNLYKNHVYPVLVAQLGDPTPVRRIRAEIIPYARGTVLEIGVGPGTNLPYYDPSQVKRVLAVEPNPGMLRLARQRQPPAGLAVEFLCLAGERIPLDPASIDAVVSTFTLCTVLRVGEVLNGVAAVLRSGGALVFLENSVAIDGRVHRWQRWWNPVLHRVFQGLVLTRDIPALIRSVGLRITRLDCGYLGRYPKSWSHACWGIAIKD